MTTTAEQISVQEARRHLLQLREKECWSLKSGGAAGGSIVLSIGGKVRREHALRNPALTDTERRFEGTIQALVLCGWRLHSKGKVVASDSSAERDRTRALRSLRGQRIKFSELYEATGDLRLHFERGHILELVADYTPTEEDLDNWHVSFGEDCLSHSLSGRLQFTRKQNGKS